MPAAQAASLTGRELLQGMIDGRFPAPPITEPLSFWLIEVGEGTAVFEGEAGGHLLNPMGIVHGGWTMTLIDSAAGCAAHTLLPAGVGYTTIETKVNFSRAIRAATGRVRAEGRVLSKGRQVISAEACVRAPDGTLLAHGTSTLLVLGER
ncbi:MAG TPA: PaaI family thioesterase [Steroidobacteraceae bacterium]|nr:PaaI family thioesterase [Steroidobacteraceae bacterium]